MIKKKFLIYVYSTFSHRLTGKYKIGSHYGYNADFRISQQDSTSNPEMLEPEMKMDVTDLVIKITGKNSSVERKIEVLRQIEQEIRDYLVHNRKFKVRKDKNREWVTTFGMAPIFESINIVFTSYNCVPKKNKVLSPEGKYRWQEEEVVIPALKHFLLNSRGNSIVYCGGGKTMMSYWVIRRLTKKHNLVVIALPNLGLVAQTKEEIRQQQEARGEGFNYICICSEKDSSNKLIENTTDVRHIKEWLKSTNNSNELRIIFTTYQSGPVLGEAMGELKQNIDMIVFDESHRATGRKGALFTYLLEDSNINADKRWFITATPKFNKTQRPEAFGFDNKEIYGENISTISYRTLLKYSMVTPYKLYGVAVTREEIKQFINDNTWLKVDDLTEETRSRFIASIISLHRSYKMGKVTRVISYHTQNSYAERFEKAITKLKSNPKFPAFKDLNIFVCIGGDAKGNRKKLDAASKSKKALIANSRVLTEGINVPAIDGVIFVDPRRSLVDINQAIGRIVRLLSGKKFGRVILPAVMDEDNDFENETYDYLAAALFHVSEMDELLKADISFRKEKINPSPIVTPNTERIFEFDGPESIEIDFDYLYENIMLKAVNWKNKKRFFSNEELEEMFADCKTPRECYQLDASAALTYDSRGLMGLRFTMNRLTRKSDNWYFDFFRGCATVKEARQKARDNGNMNDYNIARKRGIIKQLGLEVKSMNVAAYDEQFLVNLLKNNPENMTYDKLSKLVNKSFCHTVRIKGWGEKYNIRSAKDRQVNQYDLEENFIKTWNAIRFIKKELGINTSDISSCCSGKQKTSKGSIWKYADQDNNNFKFNK